MLNKEQIIGLVNNIPANEQSIPCLYDWETDNLRVDDGIKKPTEANYKLSAREMYYRNISDNGIFLMVKTELDQIKKRHQIHYISASERDNYIDHDEDIKYYLSCGAIAASRDECKLIKFVNDKGKACKIYKDTAKNYLLIFDSEPEDVESYKYLKTILPDRFRGDLFSSDVV